jgi:hypothetical protein
LRFLNKNAETSSGFNAKDNANITIIIDTAIFILSKVTTDLITENNMFNQSKICSNSQCVYECLFKASLLEPENVNVRLNLAQMYWQNGDKKLAKKEYENVLPYYHERHLVKPGITGWAQVNYPYGVNIEDTKQKLMYDLYYIKYWSIVLELKIVWRTAMTVVGKKGL